VNLPAHLAVHRRPTGQEDCLRTLTTRLRRRHRAEHAELPRFVRRRRNNTARTLATDDDGQATQAGVVTQLDRHVEHVHVDVENRSLRFHRRVRAYDVGVNAETDATARPLSALPSRAARIAAYAAVILGGIAGALIGYALVDVQCKGDCETPLGLGLFVGAVVTAGGTAIVAVLVLRALGEWRELQDRR
jgi:hypothetical protein